MEPSQSKSCLVALLFIVGLFVSHLLCIALIYYIVCMLAGWQITFGGAMFSWFVVSCVEAICIGFCIDKS